MSQKPVDVIALRARSPEILPLLTFQTDGCASAGPTSTSFRALVGRKWSSGKALALSPVLRGALRGPCLPLWTARRDLRRSGARLNVLVCSLGRGPGPRRAQCRARVSARRGSPNAGSRPRRGGAPRAPLACREGQPARPGRAPRPPSRLGAPLALGCLPAAPWVLGAGLEHTGHVLHHGVTPCHHRWAAPGAKGVRRK